MSEPVRDPSMLLLPAEPGSRARSGTSRAPGSAEAAIGARMYRGAAELAGRLGAALGASHPAAGFLAGLAEAAESNPTAPDPHPHPIDRLATALRLEPVDIDLLLLAALPEVHEGLTALLRDLHPTGEPAATTGLFAVLAEAGLLPDLPSGSDGRCAARMVLEDSPLTRAGALGMGAGPFWERRLDLADGLWSALLGRPGWPAGADEPAIPLNLVPSGLRAEDPGVAAVLRAASHGEAVTVHLLADDPAGAAIRVAGLLIATGVAPVVLRLPVLDPITLSAVWCVARARGRTPVLVPATTTGTDWRALPGPVIMATAREVGRPEVATAVITLDVSGLGTAARRTLWRRLAPDAPGAERVVSAGVGVLTAASAAGDAAATAALIGHCVGVADLRAAVGRAQAAAIPVGGTRVTPRATWADLVLPDVRVTQLREAVARVRQADVVLDRWGFLAGRPGRRGVRLLFCGPPGTGKTLAAEVLAADVGRDLLVVDLSRTVSKWIGETEKNLAAAFDAAERGDYVLLFDEADALFAKRTEVGDARDRYANLETAYLLSRLSWFDGVAILATNLRQNLDVAFGRRLEFVVPFDLPDAEQRHRLWRGHLPGGAPLAADVDLRQLADFYPITGALIRNAAVAAGYLAANSGGPITGEQLGRAVHREYVKAGLAFPGPPPASPAVHPPNLSPPAPSAGGQPCP